jgi:beta-galactosidase/beta-glucuronidase
LEKQIAKVGINNERKHYIHWEVTDQDGVVTHDSWHSAEGMGITLLHFV